MSSPDELVVLRPFYARLFSLLRRHRPARAARPAVTIGLILILVGNHAQAASQAVLALTGELGSGWGAGSIAAGQTAGGWDGRGAPDRTRPAPERPETRAEREARVVEIEVIPQEITVAPDQPVSFSVIGYDRNHEPVGALPFDWSGQDDQGAAANAQPRGAFTASREGRYRIRIQAAGRSAEATVKVNGPRRASDEKPIRTLTVSSRDLPPPQRSAVSLPKTNGLTKVRAKNADGSSIHAYAPAGTRVMPFLQSNEERYRWNNTNWMTADDPESQPGNPIGQALDGGAGRDNFHFKVPLLSLSARGMDLDLGLYYNSHIWHKAGSQVIFNIDEDWPFTGATLGLGKIVGMGSQNGFMLIDRDGTRHPYNCTIQVYSGSQSAFCQTTDGSLIDYQVSGASPTDPTVPGQPYSGTAYFPDGTKAYYSDHKGNSIYPTQIIDRNGNYMKVLHRLHPDNNRPGPTIDKIVDTMGRIVQFFYDVNDLPVAITAPGLDGTRRTIVRFNYELRDLSDLGPNYGFSGLTPLVRNDRYYAIKAIYYPADQTGYWFGDTDSYSMYGMIAKVVYQRGMGFSASQLPSDPTQPADPGTITPGTMTRQQFYDYPLYASALTNVPAYRSLTEIWAAMTAPAATFFSVQSNSSPRRSEIIGPDRRKTVMLSHNAPGQAYDGMCYQTETYSPQGVLLNRTFTEWEKGDYLSPRQARIEVTNERNLKSGTEFSYGPRFNQLTETRHYDFGYLFHGENTLLQMVKAEYLNDPAYVNGGPTNFLQSHLFNLVTAREVWGAGGTLRLARTEYRYDEFYGPSGLKDLPDLPYILRPNPDSYKIRGNLTTVKRYAKASTLDNATAITETRHYDIAGNLVQIDHPCCEQTTITYTGNTYYAWPESVTRGSATDAAQQNTTTSTYDFNTGLIKTATDVNGRVSQNIYDTVSLRPTYQYGPTGAYNYHLYDDDGLAVYDFVYEAGKSEGQFASRLDRYLDGRGLVHAEIAYGKDYVSDVTETEYDQLGRVSRRTNPYRAQVEAPQWTTMFYDSLDRITQITAPDGSINRRFYNESSAPDAAAPGALGSTARAKDAWNREYWTRFDALNRLIEVVEPNPAGNGSVASNGLSTRYTYDELGNLTLVEQGSQIRRFNYDSLSRLTHQKLAEQAATLDNFGRYVGSGMWSSVFSYDTRSNLIQQVDARGVKTYFVYNDDPLNRLRAVQYDKTGAPDALEAEILDALNVSYDYLNSGDKTRVQRINVDQGMGNQAFSYDSEGRPTRITQTFSGREGSPLVTDYAYDTLDRDTDLTYPQPWGTTGTRKMLHQTYDLASRMQSLSYGGTSLLSNPVYDPRNQVTALNVGARIVEKYEYDLKTTLLTSQQAVRGADVILDLRYNYTLNNDPNNEGAKTGQLVSLTDLKNQARNRAYNYDSLHRLKQVNGGASFTAPAWTQSYSYDRYGNRTGVTKTGSAENIPLDGLTSLTYNPADNRITSPGFEYDPAGNQTLAAVDAGGNRHRSRYDAAGRLAQVLDGNGNVLATYSYGAGNERLKSVEGSVTTYYGWADGKVLAEYEAAGTNGLQWRTDYLYLGNEQVATADAGGILFHHADRLGTRLVTNAAAGEEVTQQLTLPFGTLQPLASTLGGDNSWQHSTRSNPSKKRFTTYDRSALTGTDYAMNRFYSSPQGRFTQVDPSQMGSVDLAKPQSLNLYAYVENDPINLTDPLGLDGGGYYYGGPSFPTPGASGGGGSRFTFGFSWGGMGGFPLIYLPYGVFRVAPQSQQPQQSTQPPPPQVFEINNRGVVTTEGGGSLNSGSTNIVDKDPGWLARNMFLNQLLMLSMQPGNARYYYLAVHGRDDGLVPDPNQSPLSRLFFGTRMVDYTMLTDQDYLNGANQAVSEGFAVGGVLKPDKFAKVANQAMASSGRQANTLLQKLAKMADLTVESGGNHLTVRDPVTREVITQIPHTPKGSGTIRSIINDIKKAVGLD